MSAYMLILFEDLFLLLLSDVNLIPGCDAICLRWGEAQTEIEQDSFSPRSFTSGCCSLGNCDDIQMTGMCIFILAGDTHRVAHFSAQTSKLSLF